MFGLSDTSLFANRPTRKPQRSSTRKSSSRRRRSTISQLIGERLEDRRVLASYIVNTAADVVAEDGMVSLREAILSANNNAAENADTVAGDSGATITDTIEFAEGLTTITLGSELAISDSVAISLGDSTSQTISGGNASRIFSIVANGETGAATSVSISGLTLSDGIADSGGAIFVSTGQTLSLDSVTLTDNVATGSGPDAGGGALFNDGGIVTVVDSTISGNTAAASASVALTGAEEVPMVSTTTSGDATFVYDAATNTFSIDLLVTGLEVADESDDIPLVTGAHLHLGEVGANGDVIVNLDAANFTTEDDGGIRLQLTDAAFPAENVADLIAGGLYINVHSDANPSGEVRGQLVFPTTMGSGGGLFNRGGSLSVTNSTIANNVASRAGGGIESAGGNLTLTGVDLTDNVAGPEGFASPGNGGGLHISGMGDVTITNGIVSGNTAAREGGGLWNSVGIMTIDGTTITGNTASGDAADDGGGGVFNNGGTLTVSNATITGNAADGTLGSGGGIFSTAGDVTVGSTQIGGANAAVGNTANRAGGGIEVVDGKVTLNFGTDVSSNHAGINGGGLHSTGAAVVTSNLAIFASNTADSEGGGLWNSSTGTLDINGGAISSNVASGDESDNGGGGVFNDGGSVTIDDAAIALNVADGTAGSGGGILNDGGSLTIGGVTNIANNRANRAGGGIEATAGSTTILTGVKLDSNNAGVSPATAAPGNGGGLHISGSGNATITGGTVDNNTAASEGGGLWNGGGTMTVDGTSISGNVASGDDADNGGGGIFNNGGELIVVSAIITGNVADGTSGSGGGSLNLGTASFVNTTISGNTANRAGGGVEVTSGSTTTFQSVTLNFNVAGPADTAAPGNGGGLHISGNGVVSIADTTVDGNTAANEGGGLWNSPAGTLDVLRSTVSNNSSGDGGGIFNQGTTGDITVTNSTIAGNTASVAGGGIASEGANVTLTSVTIADNTAATGGGVSAGTSVVTAINSLIADNHATTSPDLDGTLTSNGNNLIGDTTGTTLIGSDASDVLDMDPLLAALADNGGPTQTIALLTGSPALDAGVAAGLMTDQRGIARPQGPAIDIGAFESDLAATEDPTTLSIAPTTADQNEGDSGATAFTFTITRGGNTQGETTVQYTVSGTGSSPAAQTDFDGGVFPTGTVSFADGEVTQLLTINVLGDNGIEQDERFSVTLSNPSGDTTIATAVANGTILDDDFVEIQTNIFVPRFIARPHVIPGNNAPTAIIFQAVSSTIVTVTPVATASASETFRILDGNTNPISSFTNGVATATIEAGELYAVVFEAQTSQRIYTIRSSAGEDALLNTSPTNIFQPTDTNGSGETTAVDALQVINELNRQDSVGEGEPLLSAASNFLDVNRDAKVSPLDALTVINHLNSQNRTPSSSEGELVVAPALETNPGSSSLVMTTDEGALDAFFAEDELPQNPVSFETLAPSPTLVATEAQTDSIFNDQEYSNSSLDAELSVDIELLASGS
ncbi:Dockerin type I repeat-containing protein [Neorhodopirellula lusitana]|uniref:Dockerin type I repeat-containing protein n=1 Tax=Neorhodopirellula lusitana TaxID=445327 RepID=A0ABY1QFC2_9BACT|nr:CHRD domain-containing protein [Neorhodopirellula lusitana]SMP69664.1 Dockerin type I repeat-containing protein [Neorhodopirellula lusitana]